MLEKIKEIYDKIKCNSVYNSLTIRNNKISNCCCTSPYKIIENNLIIKKNYEYFCSKCIFKKEHNKFNCDKIKTLDLILFDECNADCLICDLDKKSKEITNYEILKKYDLKHLENISLSGGELFLKPEETIKCLNFLKELNVNLKILKIYTNGTIYNERLLNKFKELGINKIIFSIDGYKDNNLKTRKNCNYDLIKKNILKIKKKYNFELYFSFTISNLNLDFLEDIILIEKDLKIKKYNLNFVLNPIEYNVFNYKNKEKLKKYLNNKELDIETKKLLFKILRGEYE